MEMAALFSVTSSVIIVGWLVLLFAPIAPGWANNIAGYLIPGVLSVLYTGLVLAFWSGAEGGFDSLANVMLLFTQPEVAMAGWLHYLAFDLFVGAWEVRVARETRMPHALVVPCLFMTLMFGPAGFLLFLFMRASHKTYLSGTTRIGART